MPELLRLRNEHLDFALQDDASAVLTVLKTGRNWRMGPVVYHEDNPIDEGHVWLRRERSQCEQFPGRFTLRAQDDHLVGTVIGQLGESLGSFRFRWELDGPDLVFTLLGIDESLPSLIFPPAWVSASLVMPLGIGTWFRQPSEARRICRFYGAGLSMRWFGGLADNEDEGWISIFSGKHEDEGFFFTKLHASPVHFRSLGTWREDSFPREVRTRFVEGGYVELAKTFREYAKANGLFRPLTEKVDQTPALTNLLGGRELNAFLGNSCTKKRLQDRLEDLTPDLTDGRWLETKATLAQVKQAAIEAKEMGLTKGLIVLRGWVNGGYDESHPDVWPPEAGFGSIQDYMEVVGGEAGFPAGLHDNYGDMYSSALSFPKGVLVRKNGQLKRGGYWAGGQCYLVDPRAALGYAQRNWQNIQTLHPAKVYSDTIGAMYVEESFRDGNTLTRAQDLAGKIEIMRFFKSQGIVLATEDGTDFGGAILDSVDTPHRRHCNAESVSIPLWPLVYHDAILSGRHNTAPADEGPTPWWVANLLWGYYTMWAIPGDPDWRDGFAETLFVETFNAKTALAEMTSHRFLTADLGVEETAFSTGHRVVANFSETPYHGEGATVPPRSATVLEP